MRQTNPIRTGAMGGVSPVWAMSYGVLYMQRTAAKQSQLPEAGHRGGVSIADGGWGTDLPPPARAGRLCQTKPIWRWPASIGGESCKTNPILATSRGTGILPVPVKHGQDAHATLLTAPGQSCDNTSLPGVVPATNPIWPGLGRASFRVEGRCETNPICHPARRNQQDPSRQTKPISPWKVSGESLS